MATGTSQCSDTIIILKLVLFIYFQRRPPSVTTLHYCTKKLTPIFCKNSQSFHPHIIYNDAIIAQSPWRGVAVSCHTPVTPTTPHHPSPVLESLLHMQQLSLPLLTKAYPNASAATTVPESIDFLNFSLRIMVKFMSCALALFLLMIELTQNSITATKM